MNRQCSALCFVCTYIITHDPKPRISTHPLPHQHTRTKQDGIAAPDLATASFDCASHGSGKPVAQATQGVGTAGGPGNGRR